MRNAAFSNANFGNICLLYIRFNRLHNENNYADIRRLFSISKCANVCLSVMLVKRFYLFFICTFNRDRL